MRQGVVLHYRKHFGHFTITQPQAPCVISDLEKVSSFPHSSHSARQDCFGSSLWLLIFAVTFFIWIPPLTWVYWRTIMSFPWSGIIFYHRFWDSFAAGKHIFVSLKGLLRSGRMPWVKSHKKHMLPAQFTKFDISIIIKISITPIKINIEEA